MNELREIIRGLLRGTSTTEDEIQAICEDWMAYFCYANVRDNIGEFKQIMTARGTAGSISVLAPTVPGWEPHFKGR